MTEFDPDKITFFAKTDARGKEVNFGIKASDRQRHMYVVGKTGMGKSTLLENMAAQDIQNGEGLAFIDPHGSAAETLLEYIPEHRIKDVIYFAPFDLDNPVSFNVMEDVGADKRHLVVSGLMSTFKKIWVDAWSARMEYILTNALLALIEYPDTTLLSVSRLFVDKAYRKKVVDYIKDPAVKAFWVDEFANYTDRFAAEALPAIQNKIGQFTGNPLIRNIIGQPHSSFDIREIMDNKKILIMNLSKGLIGETNANLLGSMLTTRIYLAAMSRAELPVHEMKKMPNFYFYVDEFQSFANATFANILSEARKYHLNLIIAHQYIEQMEDDVRNAVFGNVGTTVTFRVGPFDAEVLETVFAPKFEATDLVNLGFAQIYLTLMIDGIGSQPFSATTLAPIATPEVSCREMAISSSRELYASDRPTVEKIIVDLHAPEVPVKPKGNGDKRPFNKNTPRPVANNNAKPVYNNNPKSQPVTASNNNFSKPDSFTKTNSQPSRPVPKQKSPEDLRQILAKMKPTENKPEIKNNSVTVSVSDKPKISNPNSGNNSSANSVRKSEGKNNYQNNKASLADALKKAGVNSAKPEARPTQTVSGSENKSSTETKIHKPAAVPDRVNSFRPKSVSDDQSKPESVAKVVAPTPNQVTRKVVIENRRNPSAFAAPQQTSSPVPNKNIKINDRNKDSIDINKIKKILQQSGNERTPFK